ncbi:transketolase [Microbacterium sorbitolivorans]|uniref:Transketolase n=1 Tax=Microbacterium sorbitolivorans TaxID=1867410 RepID=A0A367Y3H7_9MICO|nr:transketolase [Microbacterium sorbitolivorans]RCK60100.1 transketolase [Microbacterium sorbitolivorans]GGF42764.1 transketolase [Microbacterium sorbitolivorans]
MTTTHAPTDSSTAWGGLIDPLTVTTARLLSADAVEKAASGHPGTAIALAPVATLLFRNHIRHDPRDPEWAGRDRFVLSCGHASILLYTQLHLSGYDVTIDDLKAFRTLGSRTPGHPEYGHTAGVETTTGPLGQGLATAVGTAMAFAHERAEFDEDGVSSPFDRHVWVLASDGDLQEGLSYEAGAIAGRMSLGNLTVVYDDNDIQIEGDTRLTSSENVAQRFEAQGWHVLTVGLAADGDIDVAGLDAALRAERPLDKPRLVILKSQIAFPAPNAVGTAGSHGAPLGGAEVANLRTALGSDLEPFEVPESVHAGIDDVVSRGAELRREWDARVSAWREADPVRADRHAAFLRREVPSGLAAAMPTYEPGASVSTRDASGAAIQAIAAQVPGLWGGSADLAEPNRTAITGGGSFLPESTSLGTLRGRNIHWGVREHGMAAAMNGIALAGGWRVFAGTFLVFSDYQRPSIRLASLMQLPVTYIWSHDSVALGQDGPTHQPIEHLASLRAIPGFTVVRPADANETVAAWAAVLEKEQPVGLVLGRQGVPVLDIPAAEVAEGVRRGAYIVRNTATPDVVLIATGSEVAVALVAADELAAEGIEARVISMPSREWFTAQSAEYRELILPASLSARVVVEAASSFGWHDIAGPAGEIVGIDEFGLSAPADEALAARGITVSHVVVAAKRVSTRD